MSKANVKASIVPVRALAMSLGHAGAVAKRAILNKCGTASTDPSNVQMGLNIMPRLRQLPQKQIVDLIVIAQGDVQAVRRIVPEHRAPHDLHGEAQEALIVVQLQLHVEPIREEVGLSLRVLLLSRPAFRNPITSRAARTIAGHWEVREKGIWGQVSIGSQVGL